MKVLCFSFLHEVLIVHAAMLPSLPPETKNLPQLENANAEMLRLPLVSAG